MGKNWLSALVNFYFKDRMEVDLCEACVLPSLTADAMRGDDETRIGYETDLQNLAETLASGMSGKGAAERSWTLLALFAGGTAALFGVSSAEETSVAAELSFAPLPPLFTTSSFSAPI